MGRVELWIPQVTSCHSRKQITIISSCLGAKYSPPIDEIWWSWGGAQCWSQTVWSCEAVQSSLLVWETCSLHLWETYAHIIWSLTYPITFRSLWLCLHLILMMPNIQNQGIPRVNMKILWGMWQEILPVRSLMINYGNQIFWEERVCSNNLVVMWAIWVFPQEIDTFWSDYTLKYLSSYETFAPPSLPSFPSPLPPLLLCLLSSSSSRWAF